MKASIQQSGSLITKLYLEKKSKSLLLDSDITRNSSGLPSAEVEVFSPSASPSVAKGLCSRRPKVQPKVGNFEIQ